MVNPNTTVIRGRDNNLFDKPAVPGMVAEQQQKSYEVEQVPTFLRTPQILKKKQV